MIDVLPVEVMWRVALAAVPLALLVAAIAKAIPCRPATRHALWVGVVLILISTPFLPALDVPDAPALKRTANDLVARAAQMLPAPEDEIIDVSTPPEISLPDRLQPPEALRALLEDRTPRTGGNQARSPEDQPPSARQSGRKPAAFFESPRDVAAPGRARESDFSRDRDRSFVLSDAFSSPTDRPRFETSNLAPGPAPATSPEPHTAPEGGPADERAVGRNNPQEDDTKIGATAPGASKGPVEPGSLSTSNSSGESDVSAWVTQLAILRDAALALPPIPGAVWMGGIALLALIVVLRLGESMRLIRLARPAPSWVVEEVNAAAQELQLRRMPETLLVDARVSPMVWCGRKPRLILPRRLWAQLDEEGRAAVLYHELAHLKRRDHWVSWADLAAGILYWWHPVVWWVRRRLREEADLSCDAWVTALMPQGRRAYAQALLETKRFTSNFVPAPAAGSVGLGVTTLRAKAFARRITMVMTEQKTPGLSVRGVLLAALLVMAGCIVTPIWACPPDKEKPAKAEPAKTIRVVAPATQPAGETEQDDETTFERFMNRQDETEETEEDEPSEPSKIRIITNGSRDCCEDDCCKGCNCGGGVEVSGAVNARVTGNVHAHVVSGGKVHCTAHESCDVTTALATADECGGTAIASTGSVGTIVSGGGVTVTAPRAVSIAEQAGGATNVIAIGAMDEADEGEESSRMYELPGGKLQDLTRLMARSDVPVLIRRHDDAIEVIGTPRQHRIFRAFVNMIHPDGAADEADEIVVIEVEEGADVEWDDENEDEWDAEARRQYERERERMHREAGHRRDQIQRELEHRREQVHREHERHARELERQVHNVHRQQERLEVRAERLRERADQLRQKADEIAEHAEELEEQAEDAESEEKIAKLLEHAAEHQVETKELEAEADAHEAEAEAVESEREALEAEIEAIEDQAEQVREQLEAMLEQMEEELEAAMEALEDEVEAWEDAHDH